ncbi:MAG: ABC transporter substrate-binding protein [Crenarchaeota archaeon]|nr:ABC transporter substrate-binding protein [Thermoproteota archaeon]
MDDTIDEQDLDYITKIIDGTFTATQFADANNDGQITMADYNQINAIINNNASYLNLLDGNGEFITVSLPSTRIVVEYIQNVELMRILELENNIVGMDYACEMLRPIYFPENQNVVSVGNMNNPDYEAVLNLNPDILLTFSSATTEKASKLPGVDVMFLGLYYPNVTNPEASSFIQGVLKAGYIFDRVSQANDYANWLLNITQTISSKVSALTEAQKHSVLITNYPYTASTTIKAYATIDTLGQVCILCGGSNIAAISDLYFNSSSINVDSEWILEQDPEYIFLHTVRYTFGGDMRSDPAQGMDVSDVTSIKTCLEEYLSQSVFANMQAVRNGNVYIIAGDFRNNAMGGTLGAVYLSNILYPDLFADFNAESIHQEYITKYMRLDYNLAQQGVFLYPAITINGDLIGVPNGAS